MANPNPDTSGLTPFEPGKSGNPGGKTAEQRKAEVAAAEQAALIQKAMLDALAEHIAADPANALEAIKSDPLKLIKDAMDRGFGTAVQTVDNRSSDGSMTPQLITRRVVDPKDDAGT